MAIIAYVDPGLGLLAWQALVAAFVGLLFYLKKTRTWLAKLIRKVFRISKPTETPPTVLQPSRDEVPR
jgi:O-antigen/teichoic acid export membrane protein